MSQQAVRTIMVQGRIVWVSGDLFKGRPKTDFNTKQPVMDAKTGKQKVEYGFGLAVPKSALQQVGKGEPGEIWNAIHEEAFTLFPSRQIPPAFAMKYKDGDGIDDKGISFAQREGYAGHLVFSLTTSLPIKFYKYEAGQNFLINEGIKCGDYVNVQLSIKAHPAVGQAKGGLYLNPSAVQFLGFGKEIINVPSGDQIFGTMAPPVPQGASSVPLAPQGMIVPQGAPPAFGQPQAAQQAPPPPHFGVLPNQYQPPVNSSVGAAVPQYPGAMAPPLTSASTASPSNQMPSGPPMPGVPVFQGPR